MRGILIGWIIKQTREEIGLTQEQLCEGICTPATLSRIENGKQAPSYNRMNALLQRLGLPENRYYALITQQEMEIERLQKSIINYSIRYDRLEGEQKMQARHRAQMLLIELEGSMDKDDHITRQFVLRTKAILGREDDNYGLEEQREILFEAIRLTVPGFDEEEIGCKIYSLNELKIIIQIAVNYAESGQHKKAIDLLGQLLKYVKRHSHNDTQAARQTSHITYNYALELATVGRYSDAIEIAELGKQISVEHGYYHFLPGLAHIMAECHYRLGNNEEGRSFYYQAYYVYKLIDNERDRLAVRVDAKKFMNIEFS